jgi:hypothetical protein
MKIIFALLLFLTVTSALASDVVPLWTNKGDLTFNMAPPHLVYYGDKQKLIFDIGPDGTVKLGEGVGADEAAKAFWKAVEAMGVKCQ